MNLSSAWVGSFTAAFRRSHASAAALLAFVFAISGSAWARTPGAEPRVALSGHLLQPEVLGQSERMPITEKAAAQAALSLTVVLRRTDPVGFGRFLAERYDQGSPNFRRFLSPTEVSDRFGPHPDAWRAVTDYFAGEGFTLVEGSANRMTLVVSASKEVAERTFDVKLTDYRLGNKAYRANDREPSLPASIAEHVEAIVGLSDLARPERAGKSHVTPEKPQPNGEAIKKAFCSVTTTLNNVGVQFGNIGAYWNNGGIQVSNSWTGFLNSTAGLGGPPKPYQPYQGYWYCTENGDATQANASGGQGPFPFLPPDALAESRSSNDPPVANWLDVDGAGQRVGLLQFDTYVASDVADYLAFMRYPSSLLGQVTRVPVNGGATLGPAQSEVLLDIAAVLQLAPGATITVYDSPFTGGGSFQALLNRAIGDGMTIISNSWAYCESQTTASDVISIDSLNAAAAASGISVFNASGDKGSTCLDGSPNTAHVPASTPTATAVGGTSSTPGVGGLYGGETWWNGATDTPPTGQGGFGVSKFFGRPAYQNGFTSAATRSIPDVSTRADPLQGIQICQASAGGCPTGNVFGGTSIAAPRWAGYTALLNQALGSRLGFANPQLYQLAGTRAFHSPASMGTDFARVGIGSPNVNALRVLLGGQTLGTTDPGLSLIMPVIRLQDADYILSGSGVPADGVTPFYVVVVLRDANGNTLHGKTVTLSASSPAGITITPPSAVTTDANGAAVFTVTSNSIKETTFSAQVPADGVTMAAPVATSFVSKPAASGGISANPTTVPANGVATTTITVTLQDAQSQPSPGKFLTLSQGSGRSVITTPNPPRTGANGQIEFTATNQFNETVTYTAVDVTDGNLPVPGTAVVTFDNSTNASCAGPFPTAAAGYAIEPFATGFPARTFFFGGINFGGCPGASNPTFDTSGQMYIADAPEGTMYRMSAAGGAATSGQILSTPGPSLGQPTYGKDGKLYAARASTGGGFGSGAIYELNPATGAVVRTVASGLTCPNGLSVDPQSGDLFFDNYCFGAGLNDARLFRLRNPGGTDPLNPPTVETYATLPSSPNGAISFSPDGTIYVISNYLLASPPVYRVSGTNTPSPPSVTQLAGISAVFWVTVGETLPSGAAKSLILLGASGLQLADISVNPPTLTNITNGQMASGIIGPDGCIYASASDTILRIAPSSGNCAFAPANPAPALRLTPEVASPEQGSAVMFGAQFVNLAVPAGTPLLFSMVGANRQTLLARTDGSSKATVAIAGTFIGTDTVRASASVGGSDYVSNAARVTWTAGKHATSLTMNASPESSIVGNSVTLRATLIDLAATPQSAIAGATIEFALGALSCSAVTDASGAASCSVTPPGVGVYTLAASYGGSGLFLASSESRTFAVLGVPPPPCSTFNDIDSNSPFCPNIEWIKRRSVTFGCQATLYCPIDSVTRQQMAAFMNRLGTALTGSVMLVENSSGALDLDAEPVICQTGNFDTGLFERRALVDGALSATAPTSVAFAADAVASFDNGANWIPLASVGDRGWAAAGHWGHVHTAGLADLDPAHAVKFGIRASRGGQAGSADLTNSTCKLRAYLRSR